MLDSLVLTSSQDLQSRHGAAPVSHNYTQLRIGKAGFKASRRLKTQRPKGGRMAARAHRQPAFRSATTRPERSDPCGLSL